MITELSTRPHGGALRFDGHELLKYASRVPGRLWWFEALAADATLGNPVPVEKSLQTMARDGSRTVIDRYDNRALGFQIVVVAVNAVALAEGEKVLFLSCQRPVSLEWTPPSGLGATTVYEVQTARLDHQFDDVREMDPNGVGRIRRSYRLSMNAAPFGRSVDRVTLDFPAGAPAPVLTSLDAMTSTTGWETSQSGITFGTGTAAGDTYLEVDWSTSSFGDLFIRRPGTLFSCEDYVVVEWTQESAGGRPDLLVDGERVASVATTTVRAGTASEAMQDFYFVGGGSHWLGFAWNPEATGTFNPNNPFGPGPIYSVGGSGTTRYYSIATTDDIPQGLARRLLVPGSARGPWSVRASSTTSGSSDLGVTLLAVGPKIGLYNPMIQPMGPIVGPVDFTIPPGSYALLGLFSSPPFGEVFTVDGRQKRIKTFDLAQMLGRVDFGGTRGGRAMAGTVTLGSDGSTPSVALFLIPLDDEHSYVVGTYQRHVFCDPPDLLDRGGVFTGDQPDGSDAAPAWASSLITQPLEIDPAESAIYVYPLDADIQINGFPYWHTHAGAVDA